jgi:hypothetical protein
MKINNRIKSIAHASRNLRDLLFLQGQGGIPAAKKRRVPKWLEEHIGKSVVEMPGPIAISWFEPKQKKKS